MNNQIRINPENLYKTGFKHHVTYKLLFYIWLHYNQETGTIQLIPKEIAKILNKALYSVRGYMEELIDKDFISKCKDYKYTYKINTNKM